jgi:hypothetical protein
MIPKATAAKIYVLLFLLVTLTGSTAAQNVQVEGLEFEEVNESFDSEGMDFQVYGDEVSLTAKQVFFPDNLSDHASISGYNYQDAPTGERIEWTGITFETGVDHGDPALNDLLAWGSGGGADAGSKYPATYFQKGAFSSELARNNESTADVFNYDYRLQETGYNVSWNIETRSHYEHLIIDYQLIYENETTQEVVKEWQDVYSGQDTERIPLSDGNQRIYEENGNRKQALDLYMDNQYEQERQVTVLLAYNDSYSFSEFSTPGINRTEVDTSGLYSEAENRIQEQGLNQSLLISNTSQYQFKAFNTTVPKDTNQVFSAEVIKNVDRPMSDIKMYILGSIAGSSTTSSSGSTGSSDTVNTGSISSDGWGDDENVLIFKVDSSGKYSVSGTFDSFAGDGTVSDGNSIELGNFDSRSNPNIIRSKWASGYSSGETVTFENVQLSAGTEYGLLYSSSGTNSPQVPQHSTSIPKTNGGLTIVEGLTAFNNNYDWDTEYHEDGNTYTWESISVADYNSPPNIDTQNTDPTNWKIDTAIDIGFDISDPDGDSINTVQARMLKDGTVDKGWTSLGSVSGYDYGANSFYNPSSIGTYKLELYVEDSAGSSKTRSWEQEITNSAPSVSDIHLNKSNPEYGDAVSIVAKAVDLEGYVSEVKFSGFKNGVTQFSSVNGTKINSTYWKSDPIKVDTSQVHYNFTVEEAVDNQGAVKNVGTDKSFYIDNAAPEILNQKIISDKTREITRLLLDITDPNGDEISGQTGITSPDTFTNSSLEKNGISLPYTASVTVSDFKGAVSSSLQINVSETSTPVQERSSYQHTLSKQRNMKTVTVDNQASDSLTYNLTMKKIAATVVQGRSWIQDISSSSSESFTQVGEDDWIQTSTEDLGPAGSQVFLDSNFTAEKTVEVSNTAVFNLSNVSTDGVTNPDQCTQTSAPGIDLEANSSSTRVFDFECRSGEVDTPFLEIKSNKPTSSYDTVEYTTELSIPGNSTEGSTTTWKINESSLRKWSDREIGSSQFSVDGSSENTDVKYVSGDDQIYAQKLDGYTAGAYDLKMKYYYPQESDGTSGGSGGGGFDGGSDGDDEDSSNETSSSTAIQIEDSNRGFNQRRGLVTHKVGFGTSTVKEFKIENIRAERNQLRVQVPDRGFCKYISVEDSLGTGEFSDRGVYNLPASTSTSTRFIQIRYKLPSKEVLQAEGITDHSCSMETTASIGEADPMLVQVSQPSPFLQDLKLWGEEYCLGSGSLEERINQSKQFGDSGSCSGDKVKGPTTASIGVLLMILVLGTALYFSRSNSF